MSDFQIRGKLLQKLYSEGALTFLHLYGSRTFNDWSGNGKHGVATDTQWFDGGVIFPLDTSVIVIADSPELQSTVGYYGVLWEPGEQVATQRIVAKRDGGGTQIEFMIAATTTVSYYDGTATRSLTVDLEGSKFFGAGWENGVDVEGFVDSNSEGDFPVTPAISINDAPIHIGNNSSNDSRFLGTIKAAIGVNRLLTESESAQLYAELDAIRFPTIPQLVSNAHLLVDPEETSLAAGYNMKPVGGSLIDQSANRNDGTIVGALHEMTPMGDALRFNGASDYVNCGGSYALTDLTMSFWFRSDDVSTNTWIFNYYGGSADEWGVRYSSDNIFIYDGIDSTDVALYVTAIRKDTWYHLVAVMDSLENKFYLNGELVGSGTSSTAAWSSFAGALYLGARYASASFYNGLMVKPELHAFAQDQDWVTAEYRRGLNAGWQAGWGVNESVAATTSGPLENSPVTVDSGSFKFSMDVIGDGPVGVELLADWDMEAVGVTDWPSFHSAIVTKEVGTRTGGTGTQVLQLTYNGVNHPATLLYPLEIGLTYRARGWARGDGTGYPRFLSSVYHWTGTSSTDWQYFDITFVAATTNIQLTSYLTVAGYVQFDDVSVKEVIPDKKVIECVSAGKSYIPTVYFKQTETEAAFGEFEFWVNKAAASTTNIKLISSSIIPASQNGYQLVVGPNERIYIQKVTSGSPSNLVYSATAAVSAGAWNKYTVTRSPNGEFYYYLNAVLIVADFGSNPIIDTTFLESGYLVLDLDAGDKIAWSDRRGEYAMSKRLLV